MAEEAPSAPTGPVPFGRYLLHGKIATGGMATLFLAQDQEGDPDVWLAVKRVHPHLAFREDVQRMFLNEAKILSSLAHPNICSITDYGVHEEAPFIVMGYLHGAPLSALIRRLLDESRPLPTDLMAYIAASTCDGLHYAHEGRGPEGPLHLVHRDVSPQNIFVTFSGEVKLLDFGVAKAAGFESRTKTGHVKGKYAYMSPEQVAGQPLDRRSDIFSLGTVLWESLTGLHLFKRQSDLETVRAITKARVPAASEINPKVPQGLDIIITKALNTDRRFRFQTADDMGAALWSYLTTTERPIGSDEVTEIMMELLPDMPSPQKLALRSTDKTEALELPSSTDKLPLEPDNTRDNTDPVELLGSLNNPTEREFRLGEVLPELAPWSEHPQTEADATTRTPISAPPAELERLKDRPALTPHPYDAGEAGTLVDPIKPEVQDTVIHPPRVLTTVPKEEISGPISQQLPPPRSPAKDAPERPPEGASPTRPLLNKRLPSASPEPPAPPSQKAPRALLIGTLLILALLGALIVQRLLG